MCWLKKSRKAFTLLEVLLSVSISAIILVCVYGTFWGGLKLSQRSERDGQLYREMRWTFELMKKDLENMVPYDFSNSYPERTALQGRADQVTFIIPGPQGLVAVRYYLSSEAEAQIHKVLMGQRYNKNTAVTSGVQESVRAQYLMREETPFIDYLAQNTAAGHREIISDRVRENSLKISYVKKEEENTSMSWVDEWKDPGFPLGVRVSMDFIAGASKGQTLIPVQEDIVIPTGG